MIKPRVFILGLVFITNDNVDNENLFLYIYKLSVVEMG